MTLPDLPSYAAARISIRENGCWHWTGPIAQSGHGVANLPGGRRKPAHRYVYELLVGPIGEGLTLDHQCHNRDPECPGGVCLHRRCVNPAHLDPATMRVNVLRGKTEPAANLAKQACPEGHPYSHTDRRGWRKCRACELQHKAEKRREEGIPERKVWQPFCAHGHEFTPQTTRWSQGKRYCKVCDHLRNTKAEIPSTRRFWTSDELALLARSDLTAKQIARQLGRSTSAVEAKRKRLKVTDEGGWSYTPPTPEGESPCPPMT